MEKQREGDFRWEAGSIAGNPIPSEEIPTACVRDSSSSYYYLIKEWGDKYWYTVRQAHLSIGV